ncbi:transmembrane protein, putative [Medicago truncatula]|uniref:Transmembrane protein, putative n=1 Tax=Medicago truncatula TaxID=3880 RepID=G7JEQ2_MEDTR|nr:transmembrane protein, putative [Medicago truncatula]
MRKWLEEERLELRPSSSSGSFPFSFVLLVFNNSFFFAMSACVWKVYPLKGVNVSFSIKFSVQKHQSECYDNSTRLRP